MSKAALYQKIHKVMKEIEYLEKDDKVEFGKTNYKAITEEKVTMTVRESPIRHRLVIIPVEQLHSREGTLSTVDVKYKIIDIETGEYEIVASSGTGVDTQDKGVGKAMTYSYKYLLLRTFAIPTGEDPDKISSAEWDDRQNNKKEKGHDVDPPPTTLKNTYKLGRGSMDGFQEWLVPQQAKGKNFKQMEQFLTNALKKQNEREGERPC